MEYSFDIEIAQKYGVGEAIMLKNFQFWIMKNKANNKNYHETEYEGKKIERTFTYNSVRAYSELFPFWTEKQIRRILTSLLDQKVLIKDNFNKVGYDRTIWYALLDESILPNGQIEYTKRSNRIDQTVGPIPDNNTDEKTNKKTNKEKPCSEDTALQKNVLDYIYVTYKNIYNQKLSIDNKEIDQIKNIIKKAKSVNSDNPYDIILERSKVLESNINKDKNNFWSYSPGALLSRWNDLVIREKTEKQKMQELIDSGIPREAFL